MAASPLKSWPPPDYSHLPFGGRTPVKGLKVGRKIALGEPLALAQAPNQGDLLAPTAGVIKGLNGRYVTLTPGPSLAGPGEPADLTNLKGPALAKALQSLGLGLPFIPLTETVVVTALDPEPDLTLAQTLWSEWPLVMSEGLKVIKRIYPDHDKILARPDSWPLNPDFPSQAITKPWPLTWGPFLRPSLGLSYAKGLKAHFDSRDVYLLGQLARTGRPLRLYPVAIQGQNYLLPPGQRPFDLLTRLSLTPQPLDQVTLDGLRLGRPTARLNEGLAESVFALNLIRARDLAPAPGPCRACAACQKACPLQLPIQSLAQKDLKLWPNLGPLVRKLLFNCPNCGQCALACPAARPLRYLTSWAL
ncbi:MAG: 4Fe-4S dicluster domain-containing protein [Deltaproteobacteria bacterium]|nr:4Fe-4S dicluster domain-containing protein [Deltaproteobacteria bacterium]